MKRRIFAFLLALLTLIPLILSVSAEGEEVAVTEKDPIYDLALDSQGVYIVNPETGTAIYEKNQDSRAYPASTTKIMTALVVLDECADPKSSTITVPDTQMFQYIIEDGGVNMQLVKGETFTVYDVLLGLMMNSFCDAADLLAYEFGGGDVSAFIDKMNQKAAALGLENTHFENAHGLHEPEHYSSPKDVATFFGEALKYDLFREIISTRDYTIPATERSGSRKLKYTVDIYYEKSDYYLDAFVGGKSGFTDQAGRCLATFSEKDGVSYVSVLLGANSTRERYTENMSWVETHQLISYAYEHYEVRTVLEKGAEIAKLPVMDSESQISVVAGENIKVLTRKEKESGFTVNLPENVSASDVKDGAEIGTVVLSFNGVDTESSYPLLISWDGTPIVTKSKLQKGAENAAENVTGIFEKDPVFVTLLILLLVIIAACIPAIKITQMLHKKNAHKPKH